MRPGKTRNLEPPDFPPPPAPPMPDDWTGKWDELGSYEARIQYLLEYFPGLVSEIQNAGLAGLRTYLTVNISAWSDAPDDDFALAIADVYQKVLNVVDTGHPLK